MTTSTRQLVLYGVILAVTAGTTTWFYQWHHAAMVAFRQGEILLSQNHPREARSFFEEAVRLRARRPLPYIRLITWALAHKNTATALNVLDQFFDSNATIEPGQADQLAGLFDTAGQPQAALALLERLGATIERNPAAVLHKASLLSRLNQLDAAEAIYRQLITANAHNMAAQIGLIQTLTKARKVDEAEHFARSLVGQYPDNRQIRLELARTLTAANKIDQAINEYRRILSEAP
ncbi:tetratricopeptide repeat protein [Desulfovibrio inopinatus]|uniref:tetratricopeptide repeat protein n=1 Tax=Desulfovibrio inopinatus TaxID=102109 RepID=UPI000481BF77|nr:tetratricopeptide repeat protein [Desulfovibrio inopinatus]